MKANGGTFYLFDNRFDVVLTDSMSAKNEKYLDFLEGTEQIQPMDLVTSKKINSGTELKVKDVVLFNNPSMNNVTVMHRIVDITTKGDEFEISNAKLVNYKGYDSLELLTYSSYIKLSNLDVRTIELNFITPEEYQNNYSFNIGGSYYTPNVESEQKDGYYIHHVSYTRSSSSPVETMINTTTSKENYVLSIKYLTERNTVIEFNANEFGTPSDNTYSKLYNAYELYELRGDKANTSDGIFTKDKLISKVTLVASKLGLVFRYLSSIPGIIMIFGLGLIITVSSYLYNRASIKVEAKVATENVNETVIHQEETIDEEEKETIDEKQQDNSD